MKVGQGKKWTFSPSDVATESGSVFESLSAPQSEDALVTDVTSSDDVLVESEKGESSTSFSDREKRRSNFFSFAEDETYKRHPGTGSQPPEEKGRGNWVGVPFFGGFATPSYTRRVNLAGRRVIRIVKED